MRLWRGSPGMSPPCASALREAACFAADPWVGTGRVKGACPSTCMRIFSACREDFFAPPSAGAVGGGALLGLHPCTPHELVCSPLQQLLLGQTGGLAAVLQPRQTGEVLPGGMAALQPPVAGEEDLPPPPADAPPLDLGAELTAALAQQTCQALGLPVASVDALAPLGSASDPCFSGVARAGRGVQEATAESLAPWAAGVLAALEAAQAVWMGILLRLGVATQAQYESTLVGEYTGQTVVLGLGYATLLGATLTLLVLVLALLCIVGHVGEAESYAAERARRQHVLAALARRSVAERAGDGLPPPHGPGSRLVGGDLTDEEADEAKEMLPWLQRGARPEVAEEDEGEDEGEKGWSVADIAQSDAVLRRGGAGPP